MDKMDINKLLNIDNIKPVLINFAFNNEIIGRLVIENNGLKFEGNGNLSANIFFNECLKPIIDNYINEKKVLLN